MKAVGIHEFLIAVAKHLVAIRRCVSAPLLRVDVDGDVGQVGRRVAADCTHR